MTIDYNEAAELYLGSTRHRALIEGPRRFTSAAMAVRFALDNTAPVSLRDASLKVGLKEYFGRDLARLYVDHRFPLIRRAA
jgi:hypothetical protein